MGGLSNEEARRSLASVGYNTLGEKKKQGRLVKLSPACNHRRVPLFTVVLLQQSVCIEDRLGQAQPFLGVRARQPY
ncbi:MAG: hypothetical protein FJ348_01315 [Sphingomonadales bacterium]|nr:hypothetical protein [Sphingomonadales bacterium]